jgi:hypothetical protein
MRPRIGEGEIPTPIEPKTGNHVPYLRKHHQGKHEGTHRFVIVKNPGETGG